MHQTTAVGQLRGAVESSSVDEDAQSWYVAEVPE